MNSNRHIFSLFVFALLFLFLYSCKNNGNKTQVADYGDLDSTKIAADTSIQTKMDNSYEYQKTLVENDSVVYDFLAYDKPSTQYAAKPGDKIIWDSKFHIIRRTRQTGDTIIKKMRVETKGEHGGPIKSAWLCDLDKNGKSEIMFYGAEKQNSPSMKLFAYEVEGKTMMRDIQADFKTNGAHYHYGDTFFVYEDYLIRRYPYYKASGDSVANGETWESYKLMNGALVLFKTKEVQ